MGGRGGSGTRNTRSGEYPLKFLQKFVKITEKGSFYSVEYDNGVDEIITAPQYTKSYSKAEIRKEVVEELKRRFS